MKYLFVMLLSLSAQAAFKVENGEILPFSYNNYPLSEFVTDYAQLMDLNVTYASDEIGPKEVVHLNINAKITKSELEKIFYNVLDKKGLTAINDDGVLWINSARDIRYLISNLYTDDSFPKDARFSSVVYRLKYPLSGEIARNLRPFMSRYGRVIDFSDARTILLHDKGDNVQRLIETIKYMDTEKAYQSVLNYKPKPDPNAENPLQGKVIELQAEKKILERKYMELKENEERHQ